ncbi:hypothetical protein D3C85_1799400 [compost metagenome]
MQLRVRSWQPARPCPKRMTITVVAMVMATKVVVAVMTMMSPSLISSLSAYSAWLA